MDMSTQIPMAGYFIYRAGEQSDPTALEFCPPKGSDELFFALKVAFPHVKTHSDRMRNAVIEFLKQELVEEQNQMAAPAIPMESNLSYEAPTESPWSSWPSMASTSTLSSPELLNLATPASMSPHAPTMSRQNSSIQSNSLPKNKPGLEEMTGVFSLSSSSQPKTRVRRKMTETEKVEYRKRRIVKACDSCSKRKRKCTHNQPEMEKVRSSKITKNKAPASNVNPSARVEQIDKTFFQPAEPSGFAEDPFMFLDQNMFNELPATDPLLFNDEELENLFAPKTVHVPQEVPSSVWPWSDTPDWTLIDTPVPAHFAPLSPSYTQSLFPQSTGLLSPQATPQLDLIHEPADENRTSEVPRTERQTPTRTWRTFSDFSRTAFSTADGLDGKEMPLVKSASMGLSTPGDVMSSNQSRTQSPPMATLTGSESFSRSTDRQSVQTAGDSQSSQPLVSQSLGRVSSSQPDVPRSHASSGDRIITGGSTAATSRVSHGQPTAGLSHVETDASLSPRHLDILEESRNRTNVTDAPSREPSSTNQGGLHVQPQRVRSNNQDLADGLPTSGRPAGLSPLMATASTQQSVASARTDSQGLDNAPQQHSVSRSAARASADEAPSASRPSSLSADSTSTSSSSSISRTALPDGRHPTANLSILDQARSTNSAKAVLHKIAHDEEAGKQTQALQSKLCASKVVATPEARNDREASALGPLKSGVGTSHGRTSSVVGYPSNATPALPAPKTSKPQEPERSKTTQDQSRPTIVSGEIQRHGQASIATKYPSSTHVAAAVFAARLCIAWRTAATALLQTLCTRAVSCRVDRVDLDTPRVVEMV